MESLQNWRDKKAYELKSIDDKEERKSKLEEIKKENEYNDSLVEKEILKYFSEGLISNARELRKNFSWRLTPEVQEAASKQVVRCLNTRWVTDAERLKKEFNIETTPEIQEAAEKSILKHLGDGPHYYARSIKKSFNIETTHKIQEAVVEVILDYLNENQIIGAEELKKEFNIETTPEIQEVVTEKILEYLNKNSMERVFDLKGIFGVGEVTEELQHAVEQKIIEYISRGEPTEASQFGRIFDIDTKNTTPKIQEALEKNIIQKLSSNNIQEVIDLKKEFDIETTPEIEKEIKSRILENLFDENLDPVYQLNSVTQLKEEFDIETTPEIQEALEKKIIEYLSKEELLDILQLVRTFNDLEIAPNTKKTISDEIPELLSIDKKTTSIIMLKKEFNIETTSQMQEVVEDKIAEYIPKVDAQKKYLNKILKLKNEFDIERTQKIQEAFEKYLIGGLNGLSNNILSDVIQLRKELNITTTPEINKQISRQIILQIDDGDFSIAGDLQVEFGISNKDIYDRLPDDKKEIVDSILNGNVDLKNKILSLDNESFFAFIISEEKDYKKIQENPHILDSFFENPAMVTKLLIKYPEFNKSSRENIDTILKIKQKIINENTGIDSNTSEFRKLIQEELMKYKENKNIVNQMSAEGINIDSWINYDEEIEFELGGKESSFIELIKPPTDRIKIILDRFNNVTSNVLSEYRDELLEAQVSLVNENQVKEKIEQMNLLAQNAIDSGNQGKAEGIKKGIENLEKQLENSKKVSVWIKVMGEIDLVKKMFNKTLKINEEVTKLSSQNEKLSSDSEEDNQKTIFQNKKKMNKLVEEFSISLNSLSNRIDDYFNNIRKIVSETLGEDRAESLIQEIKSDLEEHVDHFNSDKNALENILKEDDDDREGALVKIKVWDRNPDIDLYMGNYTDCCIRIDSDYHGSDSPISDYVTDLGIQVVAAYDSETGKPFAAAWCYPGINEDGDKAFVVDNIEAYGPNMKYKDKITEEFERYIGKFSKKVGLDTLSQGSYNNDIEITSNLEEEYTKIGGYNDPEGYYLEAEPDIVREEEFDEYHYYGHYNEEGVDEYSELQQELVSVSEELGAVGL